ncbi:hypothetical protein CO058_04230 [candidate division WWE3 bacterium CG_4_9_14_0_2_um_filter_35_11]|uniref:Uncharacterized protein n=1 Tax=candidate division WWE3 bacterium CG_4_9_14_0_2_um_filter_35_11 TaxID=1975077 RepID=A0A2M8EKL7_UNCKA|nr:MAG: hypothetical protein COV25_01135 [candidate division WWE3 bacterium CG10_big_fil_rev_8_21_14_0_10_35_32]PJC23284.1 MAG: hypothetical protein CO058_04230 [candidate division WWE3 bacterium CG_4_9_14_0_2_um_filter_35_11]
MIIKTKVTKITKQIPLTKEYFETTLKNYPTKKYFEKTLKKQIKSELKNYPTKLDLKRELVLYATKNDLYDLENRLGLRFDKLTDNIMQFKDDIVSMYLKIETETVSMKSLYDRHSGKIEAHELRITNLETKNI